MIREATAGDEPALARTLGLAFQEDPLQRHMLPDPARRARVIEGSFAVYLRGYRDRGMTWTSDDHAAAAVWGLPGAWHLPLAVQARMAAPLLRAWGARRLVPNVRAWRSVERVHPDAPHWYLHILGVRPDRQGRGLGSAVMRPGLERADAAALPAYVETAQERNLPLYRRAGFRDHAVVDVPAGPRVWCLWREPGAG